MHEDRQAQEGLRRTDMILVQASVINARTGHPQELGTVLIANIGGDEKWGSYEITCSWAGRQHVLSSFDRERGAWALISDALDAFLPTDERSSDNGRSTNRQQEGGKA